MEIASRILILTVGGACGVNARYWLGLLVARWLGTRFPWATFAINVSGSFGIGLIAVVMAGFGPHPMWRIFALTGFLGGYTTFSSYLFESVTLWESGERSLALANLVGSVGAGLIATVLGMALGRWLVEPITATPQQTAVIEHRLESISTALAGAEAANDANGNI